MKFLLIYISLPYLTFIILAIRSFLSIVILYELSKCLKILIKKKKIPESECRQPRLLYYWDVD